MQNFTVLTQGRTKEIWSPFRFDKKMAVRLAKNMNDLTDSEAHLPIELKEDQLKDFIPRDPKWGLYDIMAMLGMINLSSVDDFLTRLGRY